MCVCVFLSACASVCMCELCVLAKHRNIDALCWSRIKCDRIGLQSCHHARSPTMIPVAISSAGGQRGTWQWDPTPSYHMIRLSLLRLRRLQVHVMDGSRPEGPDYEFMRRLIVNHFFRAKQGLRIRFNLHPLLINTLKMSETAPPSLC